MQVLDALVAEYRRIDDVAFWSEAQKAAARAVLRGVAARTGVYREFAATSEVSADIIWLKLTQPPLGVVRGR